MSPLPRDERVPPNTRRAHCQRCLRPATACICRWIRPTANDAEVLVLQHPTEVTHAKGSASLLTLSLRSCTVLIGEALPPDALRDHLWRPSREGRAIAPILLYPGTDPHHTGEAIQEASDAASWRLVVIDATWRKSLRMLHHNPILQRLPRLSLDMAAPSRYAIRKAPRPGQLSTLEATCHALTRLEAQPHRYAPLLEAFDGFVSMQAAYAGPTP